LLFAYLETYGELALPRIEGAVRTFADAGLVRGLPDAAEELSVWRRLGRFLVKNLIRVELSIKGLDPLVERAYHSFVWRFFTPFAVFLLWALTLVGLWGFLRAGQHQALFDVGGAGVVGVIAVVAGYILATTLHELAHAFAVKSYGRRVNRGGFLLMMGMPFAFVDTSDMWFGTSYSRVVVAISGPLTTTGVAGAAALSAAFVPDPRVAGICYTLAFGLYVNTLYNLIPLVPLDGYQALADALRTPRLKEEAKEYFARGLWRDLRARRRPSPRGLGLAIFGLLSILCLYGFVSLAVLTWNSRLGALLRDEVPQPWLSVIVVVVLGLVFFPLWYPKALALVTYWRGVRERRNAEAVTQGDMTTESVDSPSHESDAAQIAVDRR
jgi:putative peptide zinc metalloprotease protein